MPKSKNIGYPSRCLTRVFSLFLIGSVVAYGQGKSKKNNPPTVSITSPANGARFNAGENITISAAASDADGVVKKVEFFANGSLLNTDTAAPFTFIWSNVGASTNPY